MQRSCSYGVEEFSGMCLWWPTTDDSIQIEDCYILNPNNVRLKAITNLTVESK